MNFRSCQYFIAVCEAGSISAAAKRLFISQQSLSQHIRHLEKELDAPLFHRDNPLTLTDAGHCVYETATAILSSLDHMERTLAALRAEKPYELVLGALDYGTPEFVPALIEAFLHNEQNMLIRTKQVPPGAVIPSDTPLVFAAREAGPGFTSELLFSDRLAVCVSDELLGRQYGDTAQERKQRLRRGDLTALEGCPFVRAPQNTPMYALGESAVAAAGFEPVYLPIIGEMNTLMQLCIDGKAAMITFLGSARRTRGMSACYPILSFPDPLPAGYICYRTNEVLSPPARRFLDLSRRFLRRYGEESV